MPLCPDKTTIALAVNRAKQLGLSQLVLSDVLGVSQSQISRIFSGKTSSSSKLAIDLCNYVFQAAGGISREAIADNDDLMDALTSVWDGSPGHARALAGVIRSLALLTTSPQSDGSKS